MPVLSEFMSRSQLIPRLSWGNAAAAVLLGFVAGCATGTTPKTASHFTFYPSPPDPPRLQFLTSLSGEKDLGGGPGKFAAFVTGANPVQRAISKPYGLALNRGQLYVCDTSESSIVILNLVKRKLSYLDPKDGGQLRTPINITLDQDGTRYIADRGLNQVLVFGPDDTFRGVLGNSPSNALAQAEAAARQQAGLAAEPKGLQPTDVALTSSRIYVTDLGENCVRVYDKVQHELRFKIPLSTNDPAARLFAPTNLAIDSNQCLYVSDFAGSCVKKYDAEGKYLRTFGRAGDRPGEFARPKGVAVDREGRVYVVDAAAQVIQIFDAEGRLLLFFGEAKGDAAPLELPAKVVIDYDHVELFRRYAAPDFQLEYLVLATNQLGEAKINVYGFGHQQQARR